MYIKEMIVVEGKSDTNAIKEAVQADTIETNGSAVNQQTIDMVRHAQIKRGVIVFTDPDIPGERIRKIISQAVPGCKHAFLTRTEATGAENESLGIEHASPEVIRHALKNVYTELTATPEAVITRKDLLAYGLIAGKKAKRRREQLGEKLHIGYTNGKQLLKRLNTFQIPIEEFRAASEEVMREEDEQ